MNDPVEIVAAASGFVCVVLVAAQRIWNFPIGLLSSGLYLWVFFGAKLYSDVLLQMFFIVLQIYGWRHWLAGRLDAPLPVTRCTPIQFALTLVAAACGTAALGFVMAEFTDAALPYWDAFIGATSVAAQFLLARKKLESWLLWVAVDVVAVGVYYQKDLKPTTILYSVFLVLAVAGYFRWKWAARARA